MRSVNLLATAVLAVGLIGVGWDGSPAMQPATADGRDHVRFEHVSIGNRLACACLAPGSDPSVLRGIERLMGHPSPNAFAAANRWNDSAHGGSGTIGTPITLTYSFVPDGPIVADSLNLINELHASLDAAFGSTEAWKDIFRESFEAWGAVTGIEFIEETNDDGANWPDAHGQIGVRGDIRILGVEVDGPSNVLAYNYFPSYGDMVLDIDEDWGDSTGNHRFLRNTLTHEMGHGIGLEHVWPLDGSKLMEPFLNMNFLGPQDDDIRGGQYFYDDFAAGNTQRTDAEALGTFSDGMNQSGLALRNHEAADWFWLAASPGDRFSVSAMPVGGQYQVGSSSSNTPSTDTLRQLPLSVALYDAAGNPLRSASAAAGEVAETVPYEIPSGASGVFVQVHSAATSGSVQRYSLGADASATPLHTLEVSAINGETLAAQAQPADASGTGSVDLTGATSLVYLEGTSVALTAAEGADGLEFTRWVVDEVPQPDGQRTVTVTMTADATARAHYGEVFDALVTGNRSVITGESTQLSVEATGGQPPYTFSWAPAAQFNNPTGAVTQVTPVPGTDVTLTVRDVFGEEIVKTLGFTFVEPLAVSISPDQHLQIGRFALLETDVTGGTPPYKYAWSPVAPQTDPTQAAYAPKVAESGSVTYTVTVTDAAGRQRTAASTVSAIELLAVQLPEEIVATAGETLSLEAGVSGGIPPYEVRWFFGPKLLGETATLSLTAEVTGLYLAEASDASGQTVARVVRVEVAEPLEVVATAARTRLKPGEGVVLEALVEGGTPPLDFAWSPARRLTDPLSMRPQAMPDQSTLYTVTVTDGRGRTASDEIRLVVESGVSQPLDDPFTPGTSPEIIPVAPAPLCGVGLASFGPLTALCLIGGRRRR